MPPLCATEPALGTLRPDAGRRIAIRPAEEADLPRLVELGQRFLHSTPYRNLMGDNVQCMADTAESLLTNDDGLVLVAADPHDGPVGMIGMLAFRHHLSGERIAGELFWYVDPEARGVGLQLLRGAEAWAKGKQAVRIQMVAPTAQVGKVYERLGYACIEMTYQRSL